MENELQSTEINYLSSEHLVHFFNEAERKANKDDQRKHKEMKTQQHDSTHRNGLETYLVTFTILYLLI